MIESRLLETAIEQFGRHGLEGASTRTIAKAAETAMSSITYHYGGKEGLYLAAADYIAAQIAGRMNPIVALLPDTGSPPEPDQAIESVQIIIGGFMTLMLSEQSANWARFIVREQMQPTEAFDRIYSGAMGRMVELVSRLVSAATGIGDQQDARLLVMTLFGQILVFRAARATVLRALEKDMLDERTEAAIHRRVRRNVRAILSAAREEA